MADPRLDYLAVMVGTLRVSDGLSIEDAAAHAGIARATWVAIEDGEHDADFLQILAIARALGVPAAVLFQTTENR